MLLLHKKRQYFLFPDDKGFNPTELTKDFILNEDNYSILSPHLFRVQKLSTKNYCFRHHLETKVENAKELNGITYKWQLGLNGIASILKVRVNHIGKIVAVGEY